MWRTSFCRDEELEYESRGPLNENGSNEERHAFMFVGNNGREERDATVDVPKAFGSGKFNNELPISSKFPFSVFTFYEMQGMINVFLFNFDI
jgi:hypothetical protein